MSNPERILLVRLSHLGDVVHALPVFHALRTAHPRARLAWAVQPEFAGLLRGLPGLDEVIVFERRGGARAWLELARELERFAPTWTVDAQGNLKSALVTLSSRAARRSGLAWRDWREPAGSLVLTDRAAAVARDGGPVHAVQRMLALVEHVLEDGAEHRVGAPARAAARFDVGLDEDELRHGVELLDQRAPPGDGPLCLLQLSPTGDLRAWPLEHWTRLAQQLAETGRRVLILSGPAEADEGRHLERELRGRAAIAHWVAQSGLRELAALFTAAAGRDARFVGCDSGPLHLATACGLRSLALCGPQDARRTGPWPRPQPGEAGGGHQCVVSEHPPACAPCLSRSCSHARGPVCMAELAPERVLGALAAAP